MNMMLFILFRINILQWIMETFAELLPLDQWAHSWDRNDHSCSLQTSGIAVQPASRTSVTGDAKAGIIGWSKCSVFFN